MLIQDYLRSRGFEEEWAGGGCKMLSRYFDHGAHIWATCEGGGGMPEDDDWHICVYWGSHTDESLISLTSYSGAPFFWRQATEASIAFAERLPHAIKAPEGATMPELTKELEAFCVAEGLPPQCARELQAIVSATIAEATDEQDRNHPIAQLSWLNAFCDLWDRLETRADLEGNANV